MNEDFNEDLADAIRCGSLVECPYLRGFVHCDEDCYNCDDCLDKEESPKTLKRKTIEYREVDGYYELYIDNKFINRIKIPTSIEPFSPDNRKKRRVIKEIFVNLFYAIDEFFLNLYYKTKFNNSKYSLEAGT